MLTLIIGGFGAGKRQRLSALGFSPQDIGESLDHPVIYKLNGIIKLLLAQGENPLEVVCKKLSENTNITIVCDEVGGGIVPIDKFEREYREAVGRVCCEIAAKADVVERVYCGIATCIKGNVETRF